MNILKNEIRLIDCFKFFAKNIEYINNDVINPNNAIKRARSIHITPKYFLIILKGQGNINIEYESILDISNFVGQESQYKKYELLE